MFQLGFKNNGNYVDDNYALKVLEIFSAMVVSDYEVDETLKETFENHISTEKEVIKMFRSNDDSMLFDNPELLQLVYNIELSGNNEF